MFNDIENLYRSGYNINQITIILLSKKEYEKENFADVQNKVINTALGISFSDSLKKVI